LRLQLGVAKELGYSLRKLSEEITFDELLLWSAYFDLLNDEHEAEMKKVKRRR
jgi:hypothetical protein